ncbi:MAG: hypothetical protein K2W92_01080 [Alphaproteobacteria bacterium]|nr:hypothetical protein [Alphaproteobacteria bacterium]
MNEGDEDVRKTPPAVKKAEVPAQEKVVREAARINVQAETALHDVKKDFKSYKAKFKKKAKSKKKK